MGIEREQVYIANIVKCRPPGNRQPERDECATCSPFLMRQIAVVKPKVIVPSEPPRQNAARDECFDDATARALLRLQAGWGAQQRPQLGWMQAGGNLSSAFLLRDPRQKGEAWKDLQMVMKELGMKAPAKRSRIS